MESALEELICVYHSYALQQSFQGSLCKSSDTGVIRKGLANKLADSAIGYQHLQQLFEKLAIHSIRGLICSSQCTWHC